MPILEHHGAKLYYEKHGAWDMSNRYPVVLLHGNGEDMHIFDEAIAPLERKYPFLSIDTRGHGKSEITDDSIPLSYELFAGDVHAILKHLNIILCDVVGFSDGAITALIMAMRNDMKAPIRRIIAIGANISPDGLKNSAISAIKHDMNAALKRNDKFGAELCNLMLTQPHITTEELASIFAQVAIVAGSKDMIKPAHTELLAGSIMHARLIIINGADHMIPTNSPKRLREIIQEELD